MGNLLHHLLLTAAGPLAAGLIAMVVGGENKPKRRAGPRFGLSDTFDLIRATTTGDIAIAPEEPVLPAQPDTVNAELETLVRHLAKLEAKLSSIEQSETMFPGGDSSVDSSTVAALDFRIREQQTELDRLREALKESERRASTAADLMDRRVRQLREDLPVLVETSLSSHVTELQVRFETDAEETRLTTVATFEAMVEEKLSDRINVIERSMAEQSGSVNMLRERAEATDFQLQRLIAAVERIFESNGNAMHPLATTVPLGRADQGSRYEPGIRLEHAIAAASDSSMQRGLPEPSSLGDPDDQMIVPDFRPRIELKPETEASRKPRTPMAPMI